MTVSQSSVTRRTLQPQSSTVSPQSEHQHLCYRGRSGIILETRLYFNVPTVHINVKRVNLTQHE